MCRRLALRRSSAAWLTFLAISALCALFLARDGAPDAPKPMLQKEMHALPAPTERGTRARTEVRDAPRAIRTAVPDATASPGGETPDFEAMVNKLVALAIATTEHVRAGREDEAEKSDTEARKLFEELFEAFPDAGERALAGIAEIPAASRAKPDVSRRTVLQLILQADLATRNELAEAAEDRAGIDTLTRSLLTVMQVGGETAVVGGALLVDRPYLRLTHQPDVLALLELAGRDQFPRPIATRLLITLWNNLKASGERSSEDLTSMAMLLMADTDPSKRVAACRHLLLDDRYRPVVLRWLREHDDVQVSREVTTIVAREFPPRIAARALRELAPVLPHMPAAYMLLATRDEAVVVEEYYELLASQTNPAIRRDLVSGLGMAVTGTGREVVELALQDPDVEVRSQALLTLSGIAPEETETACHRLLDDPRVANDQTALAVAVMALQNLATAGLINTVDRLGQRLRTLPLPERSRRRLESILASALPRGASSR